jgi:hypothetical protein
MLTQKNGTGKEQTCGLRLVMKYHSARKRSSQGIRLKVLAVGSAPSFGKRTVCAFKGKFSGIRGDVARYKEGTS